jgi:hypothetical protein
MHIFSKVISPGVLVAAVVVGLAWSGTALGGGPTAQHLQKEINRLRDLEDADFTLIKDNLRQIDYLKKYTDAEEKYVYGNAYKVRKVIKTEPLAKNGQVRVEALCPDGWQVLGGGFAQGAQSGVIITAGPIQQPQPGYAVQVLNPPTVGATDTTVTAEAYCVPEQHPVVFGAGVPTAG